MNGPSSMYKLKPVFKLPENLDLPTCMYPMKSVLAGYQGTSNTMEKDVKNEVLQEISDKVKFILKVLNHFFNPPLLLAIFL